MTHVLFASVAQSFSPSMTLDELEVWVERAWAISVGKASTADRVVAVLDGKPIAAWRVRAAFPTDETYVVRTGDERPRAGLSLGATLPILPSYNEVPALRRGVRVVDLDCDPLPIERA